MVEANNAGALVVSSELEEELVLMCDKVLIIRDGHVEDVLTGDRITENNMMAEITASGNTKQQTEDNKVSDKSNSLKQPQGSLGKTIRNYKLELGMTVILIVLYIVLHAVTERRWAKAM